MGCGDPSCRWTFYDVTDNNNDFAKENCNFPGLSFSLTKYDDQYCIQYRAFTLQDQDNESTYKYVIKVKMQYCLVEDGNSHCKDVRDICGIEAGSGNDECTQNSLYEVTDEAGYVTYDCSTASF